MSAGCKPQFFIHCYGFPFGKSRNTLVWVFELVHLGVVQVADAEVKGVIAKMPLFKIFSEITALLESLGVLWSFRGY